MYVCPAEEQRELNEAEAALVVLSQFLDILEDRSSWWCFHHFDAAKLPQQLPPILVEDSVTLNAQCFTHRAICAVFIKESDSYVSAAAVLVNSAQQMAAAALAVPAACPVQPLGDFSHANGEEGLAMISSSSSDDSSLSDDDESDEYICSKAAHPTTVAEQLTIEHAYCLQAQLIALDKSFEGWKATLSARMQEVVQKVFEEPLV